MAKKKITKRTARKAKGLLENHPNLIWLVPLLIVAYYLFTIIVKP